MFEPSKQKIALSYTDKLNTHLMTIFNQNVPLLEARDLSKSYGSVQALDSASFTVGPGITGLLGPNGAGKSTAIRIFLGLTDATSGSALVMGADARNPQARTRLGYMPEHDCLPPNQSAAYFVTHMAEVSGIPPSRSRALAADTLRHVGLFEERYRPIGGYSTGMKQRVKLAQALVHDPVLVLLDEPTAGLDPTGRTEMLNLIRRIAREFGISLVLSTHLMQDVERTCDNIVLLDGGQVKESSDVASLTEETEFVYVEVANNREQFMAELSSRNLNHVLEGNAISISDVDGAKFDDIRDSLVASEARLVRMGPRQRSLIDLFRSN